MICAVVMGVSGCGKSTVGAALAREINASFLDADDFHPLANKEKMKRGEPLNDDDRAPWLALLNVTLKKYASEKRDVVLACSALKQRYRDALSRDLPELRLIHLVGTKDEIAAQISHRKHEYMPASLLDSQFAALEKPADAIEISVRTPLAKKILVAKRALFVP